MDHEIQMISSGMSVKKSHVPSEEEGRIEKNAGREKLKLRKTLYFCVQRKL